MVDAAPGVPAGFDTIHVGGQNGVGRDGALVGPGVAEQARQAFANLRTCLGPPVPSSPTS